MPKIEVLHRLWSNDEAEDTPQVRLSELTSTLYIAIQNPFGMSSTSMGIFHSVIERAWRANLGYETRTELRSFMQYVRAIKLSRRKMVHRPGIDIDSRSHDSMLSLLVDVIGHLQANLALGSGVRSVEWPSNLCASLTVDLTANVLKLSPISLIGFSEPSRSRCQCCNMADEPFPLVPGTTVERFPLRREPKTCQYHILLLIAFAGPAIHFIAPPTRLHNAA